jgi:hypothetical protein
MRDLERPAFFLITTAVETAQTLRVNVRHLQYCGFPGARQRARLFCSQSFALGVSANWWKRFHTFRSNIATLNSCHNRTQATSIASTKDLCVLLHNYEIRALPEVTG